MNVVEDDDAIRLELTEVLDQTSASTRDPQPHQVGIIFSFAQATGIFKGSYTFWYDYLSAYDDTNGKEKYGEERSLAQLL